MKIKIIIIVFLLCQLVCYSQIDLPAIIKDENIVEASFVDSIGTKYRRNNVFISHENWEKLGFDSIEVYNMNYKYWIINKITCNGINLAILKREYPEENIHWLVILDDKLKFVDYIQTAYGNSEGFLSIKSYIDNDKIQVIEFNDYSSPEKTINHYIISENGFIKK